jgi:hypothetical protein
MRAKSRWSGLIERKVKPGVWRGQHFLDFDGSDSYVAVAILPMENIDG